MVFLKWDIKLKLLFLVLGQLGKCVYEHLSNQKKYDLIIYSHLSVDICNYHSVESVIQDYDVIINCAAFTNVDKAEEDVETCYAVNYEAVKNMAKLCVKYKRNFIHISSDFVYGGETKYLAKYLPIFEHDLCAPVNVYGTSKLNAESAILDETLQKYLILRVSWLFGIHGNNFIKAIAEQILDNKVKKLTVVSDQMRSTNRCKFDC